MAGRSDAIAPEAEVEALAGRLVALQAVGATVLKSPDVLFRVEHGAPDPDNPGRRRLRDRELANRRSYTLVDGPPDAELLSDAESDLLRTPGPEKTADLAETGGTG